MPAVPPLGSSLSLGYRLLLGPVLSVLSGCNPTQTTPATATPGQSSSAPHASACQGALLCDDFEQHAVGQAPAAPFSDATGDSGASVAISTERAFSGSRSVHIRAGVGQSYRRGYFALQGAPVFPAASQELYGRAMIWLEQAPTVAPGHPPVHWTMVQGEGRSANDQYNSLYRFGGQHQQGTGLMANYETTPPVSTDCWQHSEQRLPVQQWVCIQWHFSAAEHEMQLWVDGRAIEDLHVAQGRPLDTATDSYPGDEPTGCLGHDLDDLWTAPPAFDHLYLGWERYQEPTNDRNVWMDDVAVSLHPIGCAPAAP